MHDEIGNRLKSNYENRTRYFVPRRTNTIIRIDGKAFHTYTRNCQKPFDDGLIEDMDKTAIALCEQIQGARMAYVQSDEISILITDYQDIVSDAWFDGNIQKMCSISASIAAAEFNRLRSQRFINDSVERFSEPRILNDNYKTWVPSKLAYFDARVFTIPDIAEVSNYFKWRSDDASRNSLQMLARSLYSSKDLHKKNTPMLHDLIYAKGKNWNDLDPKYKRGRLIKKDRVKSSKEVKGVVVNFERSVWVSEGLGDHTFNYWNDIVKNSTK